MPNLHGDYKELLTDLIKKQMVMLGPNIVLTKARKIQGLDVLDDGTVTGAGENPQASLKELSDYFLELSGHTTKVTLDRLSLKYPHLAKHLAT